MTPSASSNEFRFPVDHVLPELLATLTEQSVVILHAPPGAGKTTRIPPALLKLPQLKNQSILMLEPRRLAAVNAARFMAQQMGENVGKTVGYTIRYERKVSATTRIEVVTEGVLTRRLQSDPELAGVGLIIFDEFHERNLYSDLALALCRDAQLGLRPDLKLVLMSATLETETLSRLLCNAPVISSFGQMFPVDIIYSKVDSNFKSIISAVSSAAFQAVEETEGDLLVFMPGAYEIHQAVAALQRAHPLLDVCPLYGGLTLDDQRRAIMRGRRRKIVVSTNVAETSLTIEGVRLIIDSGLERRPCFDAARGLTTLETVRISKASAEQRAGRAGRLGPGRCYRLWSEGVHGSLLPQAPPEITKADLAPLALDLANWGVSNVNSLVWVDLPPEGHLAAARRLLSQIGAMEKDHQLTAIGKQLVGLPTHPRLGRLLLRAQEIGCPEVGADLVALLGENLPGGKISDLMSSLNQVGKNRAEMHHVDRAARFWRSRLKCGNDKTSMVASQVASLLAFAYPDRIARVRTGDDLQYLLANGMAVELNDVSPLRGAEFLIVADLHGRTRSKAKISLAIRFERSDFEQLFGSAIEWQRQVAWDTVRKQAVAHEARRYGAIELQARPAKVHPDDVRTALLDWIVKKGLDVLNWSNESLQLRHRLRFISEFVSNQGWPDFSDSGLLTDLSGWFGPYLDEARSVEQLRRIDLKQALLSRINWSQKQQLELLAPERIRVPGGSNVRIDYSGEQPVLAVKLQELFGLADSPCVVDNKIPVLIHLLSPAGRPLQVTADLKSFWENGYPEVKKEMKGRYPKHPWPDDPWRAVPTKNTKKISEL